MSFSYKFQKILSIKETEKERAQELYQQCVRKFEEVAEKLYHSLKQKEELEANQLRKISTGLNVQELRHHQQFITNLEKTILHYQNLVFNARQKMTEQEQQLLEKNIEVKKYEKIKEKQYSHYKELVNADDNRLMDEISIQQFMNRGS
ncbi:flagellar FliJ protein [Bacillus mesophilus]|uniref:Flagellar FliJ protein n=1 Tax=Bacillus mesophilus TaxID=1808955 RepID=A0A6M0Q227_9BACI|nr:flagellar export protein FliJ [Bacillus mesophilus]MBM7659362.1 flagellar FliJ protein [Bacillus mesophilus]NEY70234.1 flagellar biosynthesis chaperone FliJ [Bacillus mesophilus]